MSNDVAKTWIGLADVARLYEVTRGTAWNWFQRGCPAHGSGVLVRLQCIRIGGRWKTCAAWLEEFRQALERGVDYRAPPSVEAERKRGEEALARGMAAVERGRGRH